MTILSQADRWRRPRACERCGTEQSGENGFEIEAAIETVLHFGEITMGIFGEIEGMVRSRDRGLEVAEHGVHAKECGVLNGLAAGADDDGLMDRDVVGQAAKAVQAIGDHPSRRGQGWPSDRSPPW